MWPFILWPLEVVEIKQGNKFNSPWTTLALSEALAWGIFLVLRIIQPSEIVYVVFCSQLKDPFKKPQFSILPVPSEYGFLKIFLNFKNIIFILSLSFLSNDSIAFGKSPPTLMVSGLPLLSDYIV